MEFRQYKDGSCDIVFSWREKFIILKKGKIYLSPEAVKHFGNNLVKIVADWQDLPQFRAGSVVVGCVLEDYQ